MFIRSKSALHLQKLYRANQALGIAQQKLKDGSNNKPNIKPGVNDKIKFYRAIKDKCLQAYNESKSPQTYALAKMIILELLSEIYQCGNCGELSAHVFLYYLRTGINEPIEKVHIESDNKFINHAFTIVNRDKAPNIEKTKKWQPKSDKLYIVDPWLNSKVKEHKTDNMPSQRDLFFSNARIKSITVNLCVEKDFDNEKWNNIIKFLEQLKLIITEKLLEDIIKNNNIPFNAKDEHAKIMAKIDEKIIEYAACKVDESAKLYDKPVLHDNHF